MRVRGLPGVTADDARRAPAATGRDPSTIWCSASSGPTARTGCGSPTSPSTAPARAGSTSPSCSTCSAAGSWAGRSPITCAPSSSSTRCEMASWRRRPRPARSLHSDHGVQLHAAGCSATGSARPACSARWARVGDCFDNAVAESFFATLQSELLDRPTWPTRGRARPRDVRVDRSLLQPHPPPLHPRLPQPRRLRDPAPPEDSAGPPPRPQHDPSPPNPTVRADRGHFSLWRCRSELRAICMGVLSAWRLAGGRGRLL